LFQLLNGWLGSESVAAADSMTEKKFSRLFFVFAVFRHVERRMKNFQNLAVIRPEVVGELKRQKNFTVIAEGLISIKARAYCTD
jgi:hypothetical protein